MVYEDLLVNTKPNLVVPELGECFEWQGAKTVGYGQKSFMGVTWYTHRLAWFLVKGEDPGDVLVCHKCDNRACINIGHLFLGTHSDNTLDSVSKGRHPKASKTHCPFGHEYTPENVFINSKGDRICRECKRQRDHNYYIKRKHL